MALNQELQELNRAMAIKASVVQAILHNNKEILENDHSLQENQKKVAALEKERDELLKQLKQTKVLHTYVNDCVIFIYNNSFLKTIYNKFIE